MTEYRLIRSRRKSLAVQITPQGEVIVRAPNRLPLPVIEDFLRQKQDWITSRAGRARERQQAVQAFCLTENALLPLRGKTYPVTLWDRPSAGFDGERFFLPYGDDAAQKAALTGCYKQLGEEYLPARTRELAAVLGISPNTVTVGGAKTRWGSCSGKGNIRFSWRLMTAPDPAVDYVIVHELCHIRELNHSPRFWALVERAFPDYRQRQTLLRKAQEHPVFSF